MIKYSNVSWNSKPFNAYQKADFDLESGSIKRPKKPKSWSSPPIRMVRYLRDWLQYHYKLHPFLLFFVLLSVGITILIVLSFHGALYYPKFDVVDYDYPFAKLKNLVMVAGHSVYTSSNYMNVDKEDAWFLESYQKNPGQVATFLSHIQKGIEYTAKDDGALLLFSGGETRKEAGPRSSKGWFGKEGSVKWRSLTEEHARDSFENLLFSVCRFRELTGRYPHNITVVSYDFKEHRFAHLHRSAIKFPMSRFFYLGTPISSSSQSAAMKGEALARGKFEEDPYGCIGPLHRKKLRRDPFHRSIPYPNGCPEIHGLFRYCGSSYSGSLPWA